MFGMCEAFFFTNLTSVRLACVTTIFQIAPFNLTTKFVRKLNYHQELADNVLKRILCMSPVPESISCDHIE